MDTKSKKSKYNILVKAVALVLVAVFAFFTAFEGVNFLRKAVYYSDNGKGITNTLSFNLALEDTLSNISNLQQTVCEYPDWEYISYADFLKTEQAKSIKKEYSEKTEYVFKLYDTIQELKKLEPNEKDDDDILTFWVSPDGYNYYDENGNEFLAGEFDDYIEENYPETSYRILQGDYDSYNYTYNESATMVTAVKNYVPEVTDKNELFVLKKSYATYDEWLTKYTQLRKEIFSYVDDATSKDTISEELQSLCSSELSSTYDARFKTTENLFEHFVNVKFVLRENTTGNIISNIDKSERKDFIKNIQKDCLAYIYFDGKELHAPSLEISEEESLLKFLKEADTISANRDYEEYVPSLFNGYSVYVQINKELKKGDVYFNISNTYTQIKSTPQEIYLAATLVFALLTLVAICFLCVISGKREDGSIKLLIFDKIPFVIKIVINFALMSLLAAAAISGIIVDSEPASLLGNHSNFSPFIWLMTTNTLGVFVGITASLFALILTDTVLYIVRNSKAGTLGVRFLIGIIAKSLRKLRKKRKEKSIDNKAAKRKIVPYLAIYAAVNAFLLLVSYNSDYTGLLILFAIFFNVPVLVYAYLYLSDVFRLASIAEQIRNGSLNSVINPKTYVKPLRKFAEDLSECQSSIKTAVSEAVKGEHLKTELITNVSHDLKTPLTSIINYVSLLKMCTIEDADAKSYIDILDNKSRKLQRLIEDLVEASKATSGNIKMNIETVDLKELAVQAVGENSDVLENAGLDLILNEKDGDIFVKADAQHTFRVIDNLFSNVRKYSLKGSRVYVDVFTQDNYGVFTVKNISREKLNLTPDELTERFVRGDNSRTTDGSGLGLSIAQSFTELQNGIFKIDINGDMFTAVIKLPLTVPPKKEPENNINGVSEPPDGTPIFPPTPPIPQPNTTP